MIKCPINGCERVRKGIEKIEGDIANLVVAVSNNINDIIANENEIIANDGDIAGNDGDIATNAGNISINTGNISTNTGNIVVNADAIAALDLDAVFDVGKEIDGANSEANAVRIGDGTNPLKIWRATNIILASASKYIGIGLHDYSKRFWFGQDASHLALYCDVEHGRIGFSTSGGSQPFYQARAKYMYDDDGNLSSYSHIDDLQTQSL